ncbi:MAG: tetratricopeptide repeat protein, partial [Vicinamibacteria bacterium]
KQYTVAEAVLSAPPPSEAPALGELIIAAKLEDVLDAPEGEHKTFQLGTTEIDPVVEDAFVPGSTVYVVSQVLNGTSSHRVRFSILSGENVLQSEESLIQEPANGAVTSALGLLDLEPGSFTIRAELLDGSGNVLGRRSKPFQISPRTFVARAGFVYRHSFGLDLPGLLDMTLGEQLMVQGRIDEAEARLRRAVEAAGDDPKLTMARWKLASALLFKRKADEALSLLIPLKDSFPNQVEVVEGLGFSYYIKEDYTQAAPFLEQAKGLRPPDTSLLNALGDCYQRLANHEKAKENFELSLQLNPQQEGVKARLKMLSGA